MCKKKTSEYLEIKQISASGKETITEVCKNKPSKKKGPKLLTATKICVKFISNGDNGSKKRTIEINGGLMDKQKYKAKKQKIMGRSGRKSVEESLFGARALNPMCVTLRNEMTTVMLNMKIPRAPKKKKKV